MKILVTGANGYLGQGIVSALCDRGAEVVAVDFATQNVDARAKAVACDLFSLEDAYNALGCPEVVLHLAWRDGFVHNSLHHVNDLPAHYAFLRQMAEGGARRLAVMGTMHEIGFYEGCIDENTPCHPQNLYGIAKDALRRLSEQLCLEKKIAWQWLRGYYIVGNSRFGNSIFSKITAAEQEGKTEFPFTTGQNQYDFVDYPEFCRQVAAAAMQDEVTGIINICSGRPEKLCDRVERFIKENGYKIRLGYGKFPDRPYDSKAVWASDKKIKAILDGECLSIKEDKA